VGGPGGVGGSFAGATAGHVDIVGCRLSGAMFTGADVDRLRLVDTVLDDCDLSGAAFSRLSVTRVVFRQCRLSGVIVSGGQFADVRFDDCKLDGSNLRMTTWQRNAFRGVVITSDQVVPFATAIFSSLGIRIDDD
jgi:uncharacterized protein YjbI with pentapeptide repeats